MSGSTLRTAVFAVLGVVSALAIAVTGFAMMTGAQPGTQDAADPVAVDDREPRSGQGTDGARDGDPLRSPEPAPDPSRTPVEPSSDDSGSSLSPPKGPRVRTAVPAYFLGDTPSGPRLYREFQSQLVCDRPVCRAYAAARTAVTGGPRDPDYRTAWPAGTEVAGVRYDGDVLTVDLLARRGDRLRPRPAALGAAEARLAVEQLVYSAQAGLGDRAPVQIRLAGRRTDQVLGQPAAEPLAEGAALETLALMSISDPVEGAAVSETLTVTGVNNGFEATVTVEVRQGDRVVASAFGTAAGWMGDRLFPWSVEVDVSGLPPGRYTVVASNDDPSGGAEGTGPHTDSRTVVVG